MVPARTEPMLYRPPQPPTGIITVDSELAGETEGVHILPPDQLQLPNFCSTSLCVPRCGRLPRRPLSSQLRLDSKSRKSVRLERAKKVRRYWVGGAGWQGPCVGGFRGIIRIGRLAELPASAGDSGLSAILDFFLDSVISACLASIWSCSPFRSVGPLRIRRILGFAVIGLLVERVVCAEGYRGQPEGSVVGLLPQLNRLASSSFFFCRFAPGFCASPEDLLGLSLIRRFAPSLAVSALAAGQSH